MNKLLGVVFCALSAVAHAQSSGAYSAEAGIYKVVVPYPNSNKVDFGTGVLVAADKILTNCHVVKDQPGWPAVIHRQSGQRFPVSSYYNLGNFDACVLVGRFVGKPVRLANGFQERENVWIFGFPEGIPTIGQGTVEGFVDSDRGKALLLGAFCTGGSSGGPVINVKGELVGLNWGVFRYQHKCLAIPSSALLPYLSGEGLKSM